MSGVAASTAPPAATSDARLAATVRQHYAFTWRVLRRFGVPAADADDAAQQVFLVLSRKLEDVVAGKEAAFLFRTAVRVASDCRRAQRRRPEVSDAPLEHVQDTRTPQDALERADALQALGAVLDAMDDDLRGVFVLYEVEEMTMAQIAEVLELPPGTVASRLRRAREVFGRACAARGEETRP